MNPAAWGGAALVRGVTGAEIAIKLKIINPGWGALVRGNHWSGHDLRGFRSGEEFFIQCKFRSAWTTVMKWPPSPAKKI